MPSTTFLGFDTTRYPHHIDIRVQVEEGVFTILWQREDRVFLRRTGFVLHYFWLDHGPRILPDAGLSQSISADKFLSHSGNFATPLTRW